MSQVDGCARVCSVRGDSQELLPDLTFYGIYQRLQSVARRLSPGVVDLHLLQPSLLSYNCGLLGLQVLPLLVYILVELSEMLAATGQFLFSGLLELLKLLARRADLASHRS